MKKEWIDIAIKAALEASQKILEVYKADFEVEVKADHSPVTAADKPSGSIIRQYLKETGHLIISEEEDKPNYNARQQAEYIWIVDPLDGTKEFIRKNDEFCICIGLVKKGAPYFGLIASPTAKKIMLGSAEMGTYYFDFETTDWRSEKYKLSILNQDTISTIAYSRSHLSETTRNYLDELTGEKDYNFIRKGSALKFFDLALGKAQLYPRTAPTMEWDIAAGHAIYQGVGGEVYDFSTFAPLRYNKESLYNPYFLAKPKRINLQNGK